MTASGPKLRILLLEDSSGDAALIERELRKAEIPFESGRVETEKDFLAALDDFVPDVILADYNLPTFDGSTALGLARERTAAPFIFVSGAMGEETAVESLKGGAADYVLKDRLARLGPAVRRAVQEAEVFRAKRRAEEELRSALAMLEATNRDLETMLFVVSHDLRQPLVTFSYFMDILEKGMAGEIGARESDALRRVRRAEKRMRALLDDILRVACAGKQDLNREDIDAVSIVNNAMEGLLGAVCQSRAGVRIDEDLPRLCVDRNWAALAVQNLLSNALKFVEAGAQPDVEIAGYRGPEGIGLVVRDRGTGAPLEMGDRIFDLFQRGVGQNVEGTGSGLAIVRIVAERHGGRTWHQPRPGGGAEFFVTFGAAGMNER